MGHTENGNPDTVAKAMAKIVGEMGARENVKNWATLYRAWTRPHIEQLDVDWLPPVTQAHKR